MILVIDNYDSFTYNLVQYLGDLDAETRVVRNDQITIPEIRSLNPQAIILSPGPGTPDDAGICKQVIRDLGSEIPILGICLGHQCIGEVYGGIVDRAPRLMHGKTSPIHHPPHALFENVTDPFEATRYHSLIVNPDRFPAELEIIATTSRGEIMGIQHRAHPVYGLQFHPESILTTSGKQILENFLALCVRE